MSSSKNSLVLFISLFLLLWQVIMFSCVYLCLVALWNLSPVLQMEPRTLPMLGKCLMPSYIPIPRHTLFKFSKVGEMYILSCVLFVSLSVVFQIHTLCQILTFTLPHGDASLDPLLQDQTPVSAPGILCNRTWDIPDCSILEL